MSYMGVDIGQTGCRAIIFDEQGRQVDAMVMQAETPGHTERPRYYQASGPFRYALEIARTPTHDLQSAPAPMRLMVDSLN